MLDGADHMLTDDNPLPMPSTLSPSAILLNGYSPATVDQEVRRSSIEADLADLRKRLTEIDSEDAEEHTDRRQTESKPRHSDKISDALERLTNESMHSERTMSDDYSGDGVSASETSAMSKRSDINADVNIDLDDLPTEVANVIRQALHESGTKSTAIEAIEEESAENN